MRTHRVQPPPEEFVPALEGLGIALEPGEQARFAEYLDRLLEANTRFNLTAIRGSDEAWMRHVADALTLLPVIASLGAGRVIDVGSGGGVPGIPLAIAMPDVLFTLVEATGKKARFLEETAAALGLENVAVVNARAEDVGRDREHHREQHDVVVARAVGPLPVLLELTIPLVREGGHLLAIKGERAAAEIGASKEALYRLHAHALEPIPTPTGTIVVVEKRRRTPKLYPRRPGEPKRNPIGGPAAGGGSAPA